MCVAKSCLIANGLRTGVRVQNVLTGIGKRKRWVMTKKETEDILKALNSIKNPSPAILYATSICVKQLAYFDSMRGQLRDQWDADYFAGW